MMKWLLPLILMLSGSMNAWAAIVPFQVTTRSVTIEGDTVRMVFTPDMTKEDLLRVKDELALQGVDIVYWVMRFNKAGQLTALRFHVSDRHGHSGSATTDHLAEEGEFGFLFDHTRKSKIKLTVGNLGKE